jgi:hypothetical protein
VAYLFFPEEFAGKIEIGPILSRYRTEEMNGCNAPTELCRARGKQRYGYYCKMVNDPATNEQKSVRVPVSLGPKSKMTKTEARQALEREITKQPGQPGSPARIMNDGSVTFAWVVTNRFRPAQFLGVGARLQNGSRGL